jgi:plasmid stability protein
MADVKVRKLDDWVVAALRERARRGGRSLEEELRAVLREAAMQPQRAFLDKARAVRQAIAERHGRLSDSAALIREDRETRG